MLTYDLEQRNGKPLYEFIYSRIREDILSGALPGSTPLPSKRSLARQLGVSTITVENAYAQLQAEGYILSRPRRGFFVSEADELELLRPYTHEDITENRTAEAVHERSDEQITDEHAQEDSRQTGWFADLAGNQTDPALFPFSNWARLTRKILSEQQEELMRNAPSEGVPELRRAIAAQLREFRGMNVRADQIVIGAGTEFLYGLLIQLLGFDRVYGNEDPGYARPSAVFHSYGVRHVRLPLDEGGIRLDALETSGAGVVHVTPAHHFPTGTVTGPERRAGLLAWAAGGDDRYLIEDDYDCEMTVTGHALRPLFAADTAQRVIYLNTFTKSLAPTIRISYMVLPEKLLSVYKEKLGFYSSPVPVTDQYVLAAFLREGYFENHINRMRNNARKKRDVLLGELTGERARQLFSISRDNAGMQMILTLKHAESSPEFEKELAAGGIRMRALSSYYAEPDSLEAAAQAGRYVINYSSLPLNAVRETAVRILEAAAAAGSRKEPLCDS